MALRSSAGQAGCSGLFLALALLAWPHSAQANVLYRLETRCSLNSATPVACMVEAVNTSQVTLYRHHIGTQTLTVRISDAPVKMDLWDGKASRWQALRTAAARFSANTICFNDRELCVINPNYLNSVLQGNPLSMAQRDLVKVHFGADGRINASCYDDGCEVNLK